MGIPQLRQHKVTLEEWASLEGRWELINGVAYNMTPSPSLEHYQVSHSLERAIDNALDEAKRRSGGGDCEMFHAPVDLFLESGVFIPDIMIVCDPAKKTPRGIEGAPDLVVEILSPSTAQKDWTHKRWAYESAGIPEYLIVNPDEQVGVLLCLRNGRYEETARIDWGAVVALMGGKLPVTLG